MTDKDLQPIAWLTDLKDGEKCIIANETEVTRIAIAKQPKYGIYPTIPLYTLDQAEEILKIKTAQDIAKKRWGDDWKSRLADWIKSNFKNNE